MTTCDSLQLARAISARSRLPDPAGRQPRCGRTLHSPLYGHP
jgi:hypothetical protein